MIGLGGEDPQGLVSGQIAPPGHHFLALRNRATFDEDPSSDPMGVAPGAAEADCHAGRGGIIAVEVGSLTQIAAHHIEVSVIIQIGQGHGRCHTAIRESPFETHVFEAHISLVSEGEVGGVEPRES